MKKQSFFFIVLTLLGILSLRAQGFEGTMKVEFKDENGGVSKADIMVKGDSFFINKEIGGNDKYDSYVLDAQHHSLTCMSFHNPKTAVVFDIDKVLTIYEKNKLKEGFKIHYAIPYKTTDVVRPISEVNATEKMASDPKANYEIWTAAVKINYAVLLPVLRVAGFWNELEDGNNAILEGNVQNTKVSKHSTITVTLTKGKIPASSFSIPKDFQTVDLNKFINEQAANPKLPSLVKAFAGF